MRPETLHRLRDRLLKRRRPIEIGRTVTWRAAVAVVLRENEGALEVLMIRRAVRVGDPWSGDAALPGGRVSSQDASLEETAMRETLEEIGLDLTAPSVERLGRLSEHPNQSLRRWARFRVTPVVFALREEPSLTLDAREVAEARWVPLAALRARESQSRKVFWWSPLRRVPLRLPWVVPTWRHGDFTIWGLTYGILSDLLESIS